MARPARNLEDLTPEEKLRMIENLWDSLASTPEKVPLTEAQRSELDDRLDELEREGPTGIPWEQVLREIEGRSR